MVMVAFLVIAVELAVAVMVMVALFEPLVTFNVNQLWSLAAVQFVFEVISNVFVLFVGDAIVSVLAETERIGVAPSCVTEIVWLVTPVPDMVSVAFLVIA